MMQFLHILNRTICLSKKIIYQYPDVVVALKSYRNYKPHLPIETKKMKLKNPVYRSFKFILSCRLNFKAYSKNVRKKMTKCSLKTAELLLDADGYLYT